MFDRTIAYGLDFTFPAGDTAIGSSLALYGEFARPSVDFMVEQANAIGPGALIDVGANIGAIALPFAAQMPDWRVVAIEAHRGLAAFLAANTIINRLGNVEVIQAAAGPASAIGKFPASSLSGFENYGTFSMAEAPGDGKEEMAPTLVLPLDDVAPPDTRLVKIDVEGYEPEVLKGAQHLLQVTRPVWFVEATAKYPLASATVIQTFLDAGYAVHWFFAPFASASGLKGRHPPDLGRGDVNVVALPPGVANIWNLPAGLSADARSPATPENTATCRATACWPGRSQALRGRAPAPSSRGRPPPSR